MATRGADPGEGGTRKPPRGQRERRADAPVRRLPFGLRVPNVVLLAAAAAAIIAGYALLDRGSVTAAPLLLVLGYIVLIPAGLLIGTRRGKD